MLFLQGSNVRCDCKLSVIGTVKSGGREVSMTLGQTFRFSNELDMGSRFSGPSGDLDLDLRSFLILSTMLELF